jgi:hypothetical protein
VLLRRAAAVGAVALGLALSPVLTACGGDDEPDRTTPATVAPTTPGDRPLVEVVAAGAEPRRVLALEPEVGSSTTSTLVASQRIASDGRTATVPTVTVQVTTAVSGGDDDGATLSRSFGEPEIDATGAAATDVTTVREALAGLAGATSEVVVRTDGSTEPRGEAGEAGGATDRVDAQLHPLLPLLPTEAVGVGASWTATSVVEVDGAVVDEVATYTLAALDGDAYEISVSVRRTYRAGEVDGAEVSSGSGSATGRMTGSLDAPVPTSATADLTTRVTYVTQAGTAQVRTTLATRLTSG